MHLKCTSFLGIKGKAILNQHHYCNNKTIAKASKTILFFIQNAKIKKYISSSLWARRSEGDKKTESSKQSKWPAVKNVQKNNL